MSFDDQALSFDARAGLPAAAAADVARGVVELARLAAGELLVEVGAGSGEIGCHLVDRVAYVGFDVAPAMVEVFHARAPHARVVVADGDAAWPVADGAARAVFGSRCLHLLSLPHVLAELDRVGSPAGVTLLVGRVVRGDTSVRMWMRRQMRRLLREIGLEGGRGGGAIVPALLELAGPGRARALAPHVAACWPVATSPADALAAWAGKDGLAGIAIDAATKRTVLDRLRMRAIDEFGDLDRSVETVEEYVLSGVRLSRGTQHEE